MAGEEQSMPGAVSRLAQEFIAQLRGMTQRLEDLTGIGDHIPPALAGLPLPGALSAAQLRSIAGTIAAQRLSIRALQAQLSSFDEQLAVLERILGPLAEWSGTWAELEKRLLRLRPGPEHPAPEHPAPEHPAPEPDGPPSAAGPG